MICHIAFTSLFTLMLMVSFAAGQEAKNTTAEHETSPNGQTLSDRIGPYVQIRYFSSQKSDNNRKAWQKKYQSLTLDEQIDYCIFQLRNESTCHEIDPPDYKPYSTVPEWTASQELIRFGHSAIPALLCALDCRDTTNIDPSRHVHKPWLVQDAALDAIQKITCRPFWNRGRVPVFSDENEQERQAICDNVAAWWKQHKGSGEVQWAKEILLSENNGQGDPHAAIDSLYRRLGKESYPFLVRAYHRLLKESKNTSDEVNILKIEILQRLLKSPSVDEKSVFESALQDTQLEIRINGARGLWAIGDQRGLDKLVKETQEELLKDSSGSPPPICDYDCLISFFVSCNNPISHEAICQCLRGRNPYLRLFAIESVPLIRMEKAVRRLAELLDDQFIISGPSTKYVGEVEIAVPPQRICDEAAEAFTKVVPDAPRFTGSTVEERQKSIEKIAKWWKENGASLKWDAKHGRLIK